ncbi:trypsin-like cysteine/serine peptidase domain-containing protein [Tribonema minus]|uniref:Serine protease n=1 Tax=Tribonema minus TaxID=303371 RepID=A0A836CKQ7_9STRA|nr:trypsin-like cysteine/serine peptidase domain-containing protein [Tribonema minus]
MSTKPDEDSQTIPQAAEAADSHSNDHVNGSGDAIGGGQGSDAVELVSTYHDRGSDNVDASGGGGSGNDDSGGGGGGGNASGGGGDASGGGGGDDAEVALQQRDLIIFGKDDRAKVADTTGFPRRAIGQIDISNNVVCSGTVVARDAVLTAAHCVHGGRGKGGFAKLDFSPARYRDGRGAVVNPFGTFRFAYLTTFAGWTERSDFAWDMAVITYKPDAKGRYVGDVVGALGVINTCDLAGLRTSGYPGDLPYGTPVATPACARVAFQGGACGAQIAVTDCDAFAGQSGSGVFDAAGRVHGTVSFATGSETARPDSAYPAYTNG